NWARPPTSTEQTRVEALRQECQQTQTAQRAAPRPQAAPAPPCDTADPTRRTVVRVVDGDTIVLDGQEKVRLIGVDTPETVHPAKPVERFGHEASAFTTRRLKGKVVTLAFDQQRRDRFQRTLAYVCLEG